MEKSIFDNSNLAESYSGITTPLTYSFAQYVYQEVYKHFCRMMGVSNKVINQNDKMFKNMLGFIGYRMYYNLINWYKLVSFLPGYRLNVKFFEKMLGVQKEYSYSCNKEHYSFQKYLIDLLHLSFQITKIAFSFIFMGYLIKRFNKKFDDTLKKVSKIELGKLSLNDLKDLYSQLSKELLLLWRIPIANDFAVMVSTGIADRFFKKWLNKTSVYFYLYSKAHNSLVSLDPSLQIMRIAESIRKDEKVFNLFMQNQEGFILSTLRKDFSSHQTTHLILKYLTEFGSRTPNELKLETETINEKPEILITFLKKLISTKKNLNETFSWKRKIKAEDYNKLRFTKRFFINWSINWARNSIRRREETRFRRTLIFGYTRKIFLAIGQNFQHNRLLKNSRDIFYLTVDEIFDSIQGNRTKEQIGKLIQNRKNEIEYWKLVNLPRRIETFNSINEIEKEFRTKNKHKKEPIKSKVLKGLIVAKSDTKRISGIAIVLLNFKPDIDFQGKILVTKQTDPGWTMVFPLLKGLIVERGGMLSHAAIVARELRLPCIVGVENATALIKNNSQIKMDLNKGRIYV